MAKNQFCGCLYNGSDGAVRANGGRDMACKHHRRVAAMRQGNGRLTIATVLPYMLGNAQLL